MISCLLQGGLGNQLFQISTTLSFGWENDIDSKFNLKLHNLPLQGNKALSYKNIFYSNLDLSDENFLKKCKVFNEIDFHYNKIPFSVTKDDYILKGYFQSEKYFVKYRDKLLEYFKPNNDIITYLKKYNNLLCGNTCSIHVRRGDYLKLPNDHPTLNIKYYKESINEFSDDTKFLVFSDDINWCRNNLIGDNIFYVDEPKDYINLYLMSLCNNNIIANSSFSWWGAWLNNNNNKKVIAPKKWFGVNKKLDTKDLLPTEWETK